MSSFLSNGPLDVSALGNLNVLANATIDAGTGTISLAADVNAAGTGNDGVGTLSIQAGGGIYAASINLRGAGMSIDPTATVGNSVSGSVVSTLAGSGLSGSNDGRGSAASFAFPFGVAVDSQGNVYVADTDNNEIRKITPAGEVSTLAGLRAVRFQGRHRQRGKL